ncbi:MAG: bifunctional serine/threonine-protein kinase/formylglycine-generating enzyme family protein [Acidobacteriota bacterium]
MKQCLTCGREFKDQLLYCPFDGKILILKTEPDDLVGTVLDDKYRLEEKIGEGAMGRVYRATHVFMYHNVAVKVLRRHLSSDHIALERFRREARAAAVIHHPNAVAVTDFGVTKDTHIAYLVMEYVEGTELREAINQRGQLDYEEMFLIVQQVCSALHAAHSKGIIHRDLKPDNIRVLEGEAGIPQVKVMDFGIAKLKAYAETRELTQHGVIIGTPFYMSPEQCRGEELDPRSDIYSLGVIIYEMLTGEVPFQATNPLGVALKHTGERPRPPSFLRAGVPEAIEKMVLRALKKDRSERHQTATELAMDFETALCSSGIPLKWLSVRTPDSMYPRTPQSPQPMPVPETTVLPPNKEASIPPETSQPPAAPIFHSPLFAQEPQESGLSRIGAAVKDMGSRLFGKSTGATDASSLSLGQVATETEASSGLMKKILFIAAVVVTVALAIVLTIKLSSTTEEPTTKEKPPPTPPEGMAFVRGGSFTMGSDAGDAKSRPRHNAKVEDFFIDVNEVTNQQYYEFVQKTGHKPPPHWENKKYLPGTAQLPVVNVSWFDASEYAKWIGKRLPDEQEWEYAARGEKDNLYPWGQGWSDHFANLRETGKGAPAVVGSFTEGRSWCNANDMVGNVAEWVSNFFKPYLGGTSAYNLDVRIYRGGSFKNSKDELLTTLRNYDAPATKQMDIGFRCAKDAPK